MDLAEHLATVLEENRKVVEAALDLANLTIVGRGCSLSLTVAELSYWRVQKAAVLGFWMAALAGSTVGAGVAEYGRVNAFAGLAGRMAARLLD
jgi:hypothetical protein